MTNDQWSDLQAVWRSGESDTRAIELARRVEHIQRVARWSRTAVAASALGLLVVAVGHAASPIEATLALVVGVTIGITWLLEALAQRRQRVLLGQSTARYLDKRSELLRAQLRGVQFVWLVVALELMFLLPWWMEGIPIHFGSFTSAVAVFSFWLPLAGITGFLLWTVGRALTLRRELRALTTTRSAGTTA